MDNNNNPRQSRSPPTKSLGAVAASTLTLKPGGNDTAVTFSDHNYFHESQENHRKGDIEYKEIYSQLSAVIETLDQTVSAHVEKQEMDFLVAYRVSQMKVNIFRDICKGFRKIWSSSKSA